MIKEITKEIIEGVLRLVETVVYSNGKKVRRLLNSVTGMPEDILE